MSDESKKMTPSIRTFAGDMEAAKNKHGIASTNDTDDAIGRVSKPETKSDLHKKEKLAKQKAASGFKKVEHKKDDYDFETKKIDTGTKDTPSKEATLSQKTDEKKDWSTKTTQPKDLKELVSKVKTLKPETVSTGTVITDTKSDRFKLIPSAIAAIKSWFKKVTTSKKSKVPKYTIPETRRRKGVIQSATSKTGSIFSADSKTIKEQIRKRRLAEKQKEEERANQPETTWSPYTDVGYNLLEAAETDAPADKTDVTQNVKVEFKKHVQPTPEVKEIKKEKIAEPEPKIEPAKEEREVVTEEETIPEPKEIIATAIDEPEKEIIPEPEESDAEIEKESNNTSVFDTNALTVIVLLSIVGLALVVFIGKMTFDYFIGDTTDQNLRVMPAEKVLQNSTLETITITTANVTDLVNLIKNRVVNPDVKLVEYAVVTQSGTEIVPSYIFDVLNFNTIPSLQASLTSVRFLTFSNSKNIILLKFVDETTVRGSLLYWEKNMVEDLTQVLNMAPINSSFTDSVIAGINVRVIKNEFGTGLVYGIINENTALITTNETDFEQIVSLEFSK